jgi:protocatechuate 3,4-dioxygenase alpha subunit
MDPLDTRRNRPAETNTKMPLRETGSQTAGPYVHIGCLPNMAGVAGVFGEDLTCNVTLDSDQTIILSGYVFDGDGQVCKDVMLEFWQADASGYYNHGIWHRAGTDLDTGQYHIETILPSAIADLDGQMLAPFINVWVVARGINLGLLTRIYFYENDALNAADPHLALVPNNRKQTLYATQTDPPNSYRFDVRLQGVNETVFFQI